MSDTLKTFAFPYTSRVLTAGCLLSVASLPIAAEAAPTTEDSELTQKPNFIVIMTDDMGYGDVGCFGNEVIRTPNLDRMAAEGMLLTDYHSNGAVSTPTRAALLTGRYQQRAGLEGVLLTWNEKHEAAGLQPEEVTFADILRDNGYRTALYGKWHIGSRPQYNPTQHGFDNFAGFMSGNIDYKSFMDTDGRYDWWNRDSLERTDGYLTDMINRSGVDFIERNRENPFCLYLAHGCPHYPYQGPNDPPFRVEGVKRMFLSPRKDKDVAYKEMIECLDTGIGWIFDKLAQTGLDKNTFVVFISDNGPTDLGSTGPYRGSKGEPFEGGHRVPGIFWMPKVIKVGSECTQPIIGMDLFPTMLDMAAIDYDDSQRPLDGVSVYPLLKGETMPMRTLFWRGNSFKVIREGDMKYIEGVIGKKEERREVKLLFNLASDPYEQNDLLAQYPEKVSDLQQKLAKWETDVDSGVPEQAKN